MRILILLILSSSFFVSFSQSNEITIIASSNSEADVEFAIINNTASIKYLLLDTTNLGVLSSSELSFTNINSAKMYLDFHDLDENSGSIPVSTMNRYQSAEKSEEDFKYYLKIHTVKLLPMQEKRFVINLYDQVESHYLKAYKILPAKNHKAVLKICGNHIVNKIKNTSIPKDELNEIISKYDFNNYQSNEFEIKIKMVKFPPPPPLPNVVAEKYSAKELLKI